MYENEQTEPMNTQSKHDEKKEKKRVDDLCYALLQLNDATEAQQFLSDLLSPAEVSSIAKRWKIIQELRVGKPHRIIAEELKCGINTVSRANTVYRRGSGILETLLERVEQTDELRK